MNGGHELREKSELGVGSPKVLSGIAEVVGNPEVDGSLEVDVGVPRKALVEFQLNGGVRPGHLLRLQQLPLPVLEVDQHFEPVKTFAQGQLVLPIDNCPQ